jgi:hypothetical protein
MEPNGPEEKSPGNPGEQPAPAPEPEPPPRTQGPEQGLHRPGEQRLPKEVVLRTQGPDRELHRAGQESIAQPPEIPVRQSVFIQRWDVVLDWEEKNGLLVPIWMLSGSVYGHPKFADGKLIRRTSAIVRIEGITVWTLSTVYRLGVASHEFVIKREEVDPTDPLKGLILPSA